MLRTEGRVTWETSIHAWMTDGSVRAVAGASCRCRATGRRRPPAGPALRV